MSNADTQGEYIQHGPFIFERGTQIPTSEQAVERLKNAHRRIEGFLIRFKTQIEKSVTADGQLDPDGWYAVAFNPKTVTEEQVMDLDSPIESSVAEITVYPSKGEKPDEKTPESIHLEFEQGGFTKMSVNFFPYGALNTGRVERSELEFGHGVASVWQQRDMSPLVEPQTGPEGFKEVSPPSVIYKDVPVLEAPYRLLSAMFDAEKNLDFLTQVDSGQLHWRIFGTHAQYSPQKPTFLLSRGKLENQASK
ncbi:hypothetical protein HY612_01280 [Candidatus Roizmanbacteria bacterium]|nr:hypothetical protein [Candidatus Roizmanbacteria bacterium]